ncbi:MAG TPA: hypothetical protein VGR11_00665 [Solirubrobacteraceae bacterium]|nr:hypothetical protein [Solirubrobacteraceae bacterium]
MIVDVVLGVHVAAGAAAVAIGPFAIKDAVRSAPPGAAGHTYHWLVGVICLSAIVLAMVDLSQLWFFVPIAAGSYAFVFVGYRAAARRHGRWREAYVRGTVGAYIALLTAVLVVSVSDMPALWLLPTALGVPAIHLLRRHGSGATQR